MVAEYVELGSLRVVPMVRAVIMMVMGLLLPVHGGMIKVRQQVHGRSRLRQCHSLPKHGKKHDEKNG
jgi:hypothetical protein